MGISSHISYLTSPTSSISQVELMEYRYTNNLIMTLTLATYLKFTSLTGFVVNATAVQVANSVSTTRFFCYWYSFERPNLDFCQCCMKQHHKESPKQNKPHNVSEYDNYLKKKPLFNNRSKNIHASNISELCQQSISKDSICPVNIYDYFWKKDMPKCDTTGQSCKRRGCLVPIMNMPNVYYTFVITVLQVIGDTIQQTVYSQWSSSSTLWCQN